VNAAGGTISILVGAVLLRLTVTGDYQRYVRAELGPYVAMAGIAVAAIGLVTLVRALRREEAVDAYHADHAEHDHHAGGIGVGWLLLAPIAALLLVAPPTLGSYGVERGARVDVRAGAPVLDPLRRGTGPVDMPLLEYGQRSFEHGGRSFNGVPVRLTGFVAGTESDGFQLARYAIACCAADAAPIVVRVVDPTSVSPPTDQWVSVTGRYRPTDGEVPEVTATSVSEVEPPEDPYE
jgi:uncharacterized repeat protein (TIGR03943 family)